MRACSLPMAGRFIFEMLLDLASLAASEIVRNWAFVVGGAIGLYLAWKRVTAANRQADAQI
jgi:hypothetical protein